MDFLIIFFEHQTEFCIFSESWMINLKVICEISAFSKHVGCVYMLWGEQLRFKIYVYLCI